MSRVEGVCAGNRMYINSIKAGMVALLLNAFLFINGALTADASTPPEVIGADWVFAMLALAVLPLYFRRNRVGLVAGLILGILFVLRVTGDPDFMEAAEQMPVTTVELGYFVVATLFSFVQVLSSYGALILRRAGTVNGSGAKAGGHPSRVSTQPLIAISIGVIVITTFVVLYFLGSQPSELVTTPFGAEKVFYVVPYHWGYAFYDDNFQELDRLQVKRGDKVTLYAIPAEGLSKEFHEQFEERTMNAGIGRLTPNSHELAEKLENAEKLAHSVTIRQYRVNIVASHDQYSGAAVDLKQFVEIERNINNATFTATREGSFDITCTNFCGYGHDYMSAKGALVVSR